MDVEVSCFNPDFEQERIEVCRVKIERDVVEVKFDQWIVVLDSKAGFRLRTKQVWFRVEDW